MEKFSLLMQRIGENIKRLRQLNEWSQEELAEQMERPQSSVARIENATNNDVSLSMLYSLAESLEVPLSELIATAEGHRLREKATKKLKSKWERIRDEVENMPESDRDWIADLIRVATRNEKS